MWASGFGSRTSLSEVHNSAMTTREQLDQPLSSVPDQALNRARVLLELHPLHLFSPWESSIRD